MTKLLVLVFLRPYKQKIVGDHPFCFKEVGRAGSVFWGRGTVMNMLVKTKISYILERVFN